MIRTDQVWGYGVAVAIRDDGTPTPEGNADAFVTTQGVTDGAVFFDQIGPRVM
jgi:hypothetical protein